MRTLNIFGFAGSLLAMSQVLAHLDKDTDRNGGHWDNGGYYHCHIAGCIPTVSRHQFRSRALNNRDMDLYYLDADWPYWELAQGCKTTRTVVLENTSQVPVTWTNPRQCEIREGLWVDEYTGDEYTRAGAMELDHVIPPIYANASNGYQWDQGKRTSFANDPFNLIPVSRETARKKRSRPIGDWRPRKEFECEYAQTWKDVSDKYDLDLFGKDTGRMRRILESCNTEAGRDVEE